MEGIISWLGTTGLRPFLAPLSAEERESFLAVYGMMLTKTYPLQADGKVLLRFPRLFIVGTR